MTTTHRQTYLDYSFYSVSLFISKSERQLDLLLTLVFGIGGRLKELVLCSRTKRIVSGPLVWASNSSAAATCSSQSEGSSLPRPFETYLKGVKSGRDGRTKTNKARAVFVRRTLRRNRRTAIRIKQKVAKDSLFLVLFSQMVRRDTHREVLLDQLVEQFSDFFHFLRDIHVHITCEKESYNWGRDNENLYQKWSKETGLLLETDVPWTCPTC